MTPGEIALMQENHREVIAQLAAIRVDLKEVRLEAKADLATHEINDAKVHAALDKSVTDMRLWRAKTVGALGVLMVILSAVTTVLTSIVTGGAHG